MARVAFAFEGCRVPADIECPPELLSILEAFGFVAEETDGAQNPFIILKSTVGGFHFSGPAYLSPFSVDGLDAAAGSVMAGLAAFKSLSVQSRMLCIHGAAAEIRGRGYLFLAPFGTGKSSLMVELAARGADIIADDVVLLNLRDGSMRGLRMPPRLRQAFVSSATPRLKDWIAERSILVGPRYTYLAPEGLAPGSHELTDIVLLNRVGDAAQAEPLLEQASPGVLVPRLLWHNMSRHHAPSAIADMASGLAGEMRCSILHAANFAQAAELLLSGGIRTISSSGQPMLSSTRRDDAHIIRTDRGAIISDDQTGRIFEINESAFVILTLLRASDDMQEVRELLRTVYPDAPETDLAEQLSACIRQFADCGLIDYPQAA